MKSLFALIGILIVLSACSVQKKDYVNVIPEPQEVILQSGIFRITKSTKLFTNNFKKAENAINYLNEKFASGAGFKFTPQENQNPDNHNEIFIEAVNNNNLGKEGYSLNVNNNGIVIKAESPEGLFYGVVTLLQLLPPEIFSDSSVKDVQWKVPFVKIKDKPRFSYRGMHLDVGRHFFPKKFIKKYIDLIAMHKMNVFHWHLTEDQGWRIEIKKYPKLTEIGSIRKETMGDGKPYGGFYTQEDVKEVVKYASSRFVTIVPEIEMPGHSTAALAAYPEISCTGGPFEVATTWGVHKDVYCAGKEKTFQFLEGVLDEVIKLFPGKYIHIGGDEVPKDRWKHCPDCQRRIKTEGLKDEQELQSYFVKRIEKYLISKGKRLIGWDEILEGGLAPEATVMSWRGTSGGIAAARQNHDVIMTPTSYCYFDYYQGLPQNEPVTIGGYLPVTKVYSFEPVPSELNKEEAKHILGAQGNVWTEYLSTPRDVEYMALPRMDALAEVLWDEAERKNEKSFLKRLRNEFKRYDELNVNYSESAFSPNIQMAYDTTAKNVRVSISSEAQEGKIYYTLNGNKPTENSLVYAQPIRLSGSAKIFAGLFENGKLLGIINCDSAVFHNAFGKGVALRNPYSQRYNGGGNFALTDGLYGSKYFNDGRWQGYQGEDFEATIDLGREIKIKRIGIRFLQKIISWIYLPEFVEFYTSKDGKNFKPVKRLSNNVSKRNGKILIRDFSINVKNKSARFVKIFAKNIKNVPVEISENGGKAWLMTDEITVK